MSETAKKTIVVTRFDPDRDEVPKTQEYEIPVQADWKVLDAINFIKDEVDPTISHRWSCRMAVCGSCGMMVDGEPKLTCKTALSDYGDRVSIEPLANFPIVRDLVVELEGFMEKFQRVKPWIIEAKEEAGRKRGPAKSPQGTYLQSPQELDEFKQFSMCINCMLCYAACPVVANEPDFLGPAAIALGHRYNLDSRDQGRAERNEVFRGEGSVFSCSYANECSEVCPKSVDPAAAVNQAKFGAVIDWAAGFVVPRSARRSR
jgi:fumarate reductase iron-sulfur subunit